MTLGSSWGSRKGPGEAWVGVGGRRWVAHITGSYWRAGLSSLFFLSVSFFFFHGDQANSTALKISPMAKTWAKVEKAKPMESKSSQTLPTENASGALIAFARRKGINIYNRHSFSEPKIHPEPSLVMKLQTLQIITSSIK